MTLVQILAQGATRAALTLGLLLASATASNAVAQTPDGMETRAAVPDSAPSFDFLVFGDGLHRVNASNGDVTTWFAPSRKVRDVARLPDRGGGVTTVFALVDDRVERLFASSGKPLSGLVEGEEWALAPGTTSGAMHPRPDRRQDRHAGQKLRAVWTGRQVAHIADAIDLVTIERDSDEEPWQLRRAIPTVTAGESDTSFTMTTDLQCNLSIAPDGILCNSALWSNGFGVWFAFALKAGAVSPCVMNENVSLPSLPSSILGEGDRVVDVAMPPGRGVLYALIERSDGRMAVARCRLVRDDHPRWAPSLGEDHPLEPEPWRVRELSLPDGIILSHIRVEWTDSCVALMGEHFLGLLTEGLDGDLKPVAIDPAALPVDLVFRDLVFTTSPEFVWSDVAPQDRLLVIGEAGHLDSTDQSSRVFVLAVPTLEILGSHVVPGGTRRIASLYGND